MNLSTPPATLPVDSAPPSIPEMDLLERIGSGAYGEVWRARNLATGAARAVKVVYRATFADERPFHREFEGIQKFEGISHSHPSQLSLFQVGRNDDAGYFYYVMELADSIGDSGTYQARTLRSELAQGRLPAARSLEIALALTEALVCLHANGLIHRDVKPSNIIFVNGRPKLADIGLVTDASDTRSIVGTEGYLAPEGPGSAASDIYALGKVLYEMTSGLDRRRFPELPEDLRAWPDHHAAIELNEIILKACAKDPTRRYPTADAMLADLKLLGAGKSVQQRRFLQRAMSWTWKTAALLALGVLAFVVIKHERQRRAILASQAKTPWEKHGTTNQAAWQAWQRALQMGNTYTAAGMSNSMQEFEQAVALDPNYASAWSTLSVTITIAVTEGYLAGTNALPRAKYCAEKAIALRPNESGPYDSLAQCTLALDHDFDNAERLFRKGIANDPANWIIRANFAWELFNQKRFEEAERLWKQIAQDQPNRASASMGLGLISCVTGHLAEGLSLMNESIRLEPDRPRWRSWRGDILWARGQRDAAARDWTRQVETGGFLALDREAVAAELRTVLNEQGPVAFLERLITLLERRQQAGNFVSAFDFARFYALLGNVDQALANLEIAFEERRGMLRTINVNPAFTILKSEPRFQDLLRRLNLEK